jgi:hypothetical protein
MRPLGGALLHLATGWPEKARFHWSIFEGRVDGWLLTSEEKHRDAELRSKSRVPEAMRVQLSSGEDIR